MYENVVLWVMDKPISKQIMETAFAALDAALSDLLILILGGGGCMILAHDYPLATTDVDALPLQMSFDEIDPLIKKIARELALPPDWLNPYFSTFTFVLPPDYKSRVLTVFKGKNLRVDALGKEDMLIMKCFAHRPKDLGHARALIRAGTNLRLVEEVIEGHIKKGLPNASAALEFFDDLVDEQDQK
jgi:hypothetical protein